MDLTILHAIWFDCPDLPDTAHKLLLALAYHGSPCWPSVERRLATMIRRSERQTQYLLRQLEQEGYITVKKGRGEKQIKHLHDKGAIWTAPFRKKVQSRLRGKGAIWTAPELL